MGMKSYVAIFMFGVMICSNIVLILVGVRVVKKAWYGLNLTRANCTIVVIDTTHEQECVCKRGFHWHEVRNPVKSPCVSSYPCLVMGVRYERAPGQNNEAFLYATQEEMFSVEQASQIKCAAAMCSEESSDNKNEIERFMRERNLRVGQHTTCYYEKNGIEDMVILNYTISRKTALSTVVHGLVWPSLALLLSSVIVLVLTSRTGASNA